MELNFRPDGSIQVAKGDILLAEPFLADPYFRRTVILICEHNDEGSFGFVLNNYIDIELDRIVSEMSSFDTKISVGGPVKNNNLYYIHTLGDLIRGSEEITEGIYMGGDYDQIKELMAEGKIQKENIRFFVGYSGWSPEQLATELRDKSWFVTRIDRHSIMSTHDPALWRNILKKMGGRFEQIASLPENPSLN
jgi:putative transcriptional regulator